LLKKTISGIMLTLLLISMLTLAVNIPPVKASGTIYIRADGSIDPPTAPISTTDYITYTFTDNIYDSIVIERNHIVVDGAGYTLQGVEAYDSKGIYLSGRYDVTIKNTNIKNFSYGICLEGSFYNIISGNNITNNEYGIRLYYFSNYNSIVGNNITNNVKGIGLCTDSDYNSISGNNIINNSCGIYLEYSSLNEFYHNNIINNRQQTFTAYPYSANVWDDGYPSGGNYWSNYTGADVKKGPNQDQPGSDGIGDMPYVINAHNQDRYPLMKQYPWASHDVGITSVTTSKTVVGQGYTVSINIMVFNYGNDTETFDVTLYANTTEIETREIPLSSGNSTTITFAWNTTGFAKGNYTISAYAWPVQGERDTADNRKEDGWVLISIHCDINGDGIVDISDILDTALAFGSTPGHPLWNPNCDLDDNGIVDISDILEVALHYGETDP
jgi:parallel beta-helix repeat protein